GQRIVASQHLVELGLGNLPGRRVAERILALGAKFLAPVVEVGTECAATGAIADEGFLVAQYLVVGVDRHRRPAASAAGGTGGRRAVLSGAFALLFRRLERSAWTVG